MEQRQIDYDKPMTDEQVAACVRVWKVLDWCRVRLGAMGIDFHAAVGSSSMKACSPRFEMLLGKAMLTHILVGLVRDCGPGGVMALTANEAEARMAIEKRYDKLDKALEVETKKGGATPTNEEIEKIVGGKP